MKKQVNPVITAIVIIAALGAVLYVYTRGLLDRSEGGAEGGGGGPMAAEVIPLVGLRSVNVSTLAGWSAPGLVDGKGWDARFNGPSGIALAPDRSLYVSDSRNHRIRRVTPDGLVTTIAGSGPIDCMPGGYADGPADRARFFNPTGLVVGPDDALYIADTGNHRIRLLKDGVVQTVAGSATPQDELGFEQGGLRDGPTLEAQFTYPTDVTVTSDGALLVADAGNRAIRRLSGGVVTTVAESLGTPTGVIAPAGLGVRAADPASGSLWAGPQGAALAVMAVSGVAPRRPTAVNVLPDGGLVVVDAEWHAVFGVTSAGHGVLLAGVLMPGAPAPGVRDGTGDTALFAAPCAVAADGWTAYVAGFGNNCIRKIEIAPDWASPPPPPEPGPRERRWRDWRRNRRDGGRGEGRSEGSVEDVRGRRGGPEADGPVDRRRGVRPAGP